MKINRVGVDLAKNVFQLHGVDHKGNALWKRRLTRGKWLAVLCDSVEPGTEIGMEACAGAHHWARRHANVVAVAMANKMARMAWVIMTKDVDYDPDLAAASVH
jgi:transposase